MTTFFRTWRPAVAVVALLGALFGGVGSAHRAYALWATCKDDPIVQLSNGQTVTMIADIGDAASDVKWLHFTLHGPVGTSVVSTTFTGDVSPNRVSVLYLADQSEPNSYASTTVVATGLTSGLAQFYGGVSIPVTASTRVGSVQNSVTGTAYQFLNVTVASPLSL